MYIALTSTFVPVLLLVLPFYSLAVHALPDWTPSLSNGCGIPHPSTTTSTNTTILSNNLNRTFLVHIPSTYDADKPTGLILSYHGNKRTAGYQETLSGFSEEGVNPDWIVVYPQGIGNSWQGPSYATKGVSDIQFTADLLSYMRANYCVDNSRVYATGKSNGGGFVGTLACDEAVGGNFAAFAPVSGAFYTDVDDTSVCEPARSPLPVIEFHGFEDGTIPYVGGRGAGGLLPSIPSWLGRWAVRNGCSGQPLENVTTVEYDDLVRHSKWSCAGYEDILQGYDISGLGHVWPSTTSNLDNDGDPTVLNATQIIMDFFRSHIKP